jgi:hypothetical protein
VWGWFTTECYIINSIQTPFHVGQWPI